MPHSTLVERRVAEFGILIEALAAAIRRRTRLLSASRRPRNHTAAAARGGGEPELPAALTLLNTPFTHPARALALRFRKYALFSPLPTFREARMALGVAGARRGSTESGTRTRKRFCARFPLVYAYSASPPRL